MLSIANDLMLHVPKSVLCILLQRKLIAEHLDILCAVSNAFAPARPQFACALQGLAKLQKTQKDVDVLVEEAKIKAVEVEKKVAGADQFAGQVGEEKAKVNLENDAAQVEAEKCGVIAKDVTELQARCEKDLAAAEPLVAQAEAALDTLNKKDLGEPHAALSCIQVQTSHIWSP